MDIQIGAQVKIINPDDTAEYGVEVGDEGVVVWIGEYASYGVCIPKKSDVYAYALNDLEVIKPFQVPEGFVLVEKSKIRTWYQDDDEPENFCNSESDLNCLGDCLDDDDIIAVNIHESAHISTRKVFGVWKSNSPTDIQSNFVLVDSREKAEEIVASNKAMIEAQDPAPLKVGDLVEPKDHRYTLASGACRYPYAYVVSIDPFQLMSEEGDMYWRCTVEADGYKLLKSNVQLPENVVARMVREGLIAALEAQEPAND